MIVLVSIDGTVSAVDMRPQVHRRVLMIDEELQAASFAAALARPEDMQSLFVRQYTRTRRLLPNPRVGPPADDSPHLYLYEEQTAPGAMPPEQRAVRLPQVEAAAARLAEKARDLRLAGAGAARECALVVARDAWLEGRLEDARTILRAEMADEVALATVQQWLAEAWRGLAAGDAA